MCHGINTLCPHRLVGLGNSRELFRLREVASQPTYTAGKRGKASALLDHSSQIGEFEVRMGIYEAGAKNSRIELHTRSSIERTIILLDGYDFVTFARNSNRYEGAWLKPVWCQKIV